MILEEVLLKVVSNTNLELKNLLGIYKIKLRKMMMNINNNRSKLRTRLMAFKNSKE